MRRGIAALAALIAFAAAAPPALAQYEDPLADAPTVERWRSLAREIAAPWPSIQERSGRLPDYMDERYGSRYGDAMMGYALVRTGLREGNRAIVRTGLRAVTFSTRRPRVQSSFENFAVAATYNLARRRAAAYADFRRNRSLWERWMRGARTTRLHLHLPIRFGNHWLIDALAVLELRRAGIRAQAGSAAAFRLARRMVDVHVPRRAGRGSGLLSDPPDEPIAYHGLSIGFYARAIELLGRSASASARATLRRLVRTAALLTAPDGDTAYWGRSLQHVWSPAATAFAAEAASAQPGASKEQRSASRALSERTLDRVARAYPVGPGGQWIVPSLAQDFAAGRRSLEGYAGGPSMSGLALAMLNFAIDAAARARTASRLPADRSMGVVLSSGRARFAAVRRGRVWFAVKAGNAERGYNRDDLRYAFGLVSAKLKGPGGWFDLVPLRPPLGGSPPVTAGPVLLRGGGSGRPDGERIRVRRGGVVSVTGAYRTRGGRVLRRASWRYEPVGCGVRLAFRAGAGDRYSLTAFFRAGRPKLERRSASDGQQRVTVSPAPASMSVGRRTVASARDAHLHRVEIGVRASRAREVRVTFCG